MILFNIIEKEQKKNFIKENMKQLKSLPGKSSKDPKLTLKNHSTRLSTPVTQVKSSPSNKSGKVSLNVGKTCSLNSRKKNDMHIKKGDMAEFLRRKEMRHVQQQEESSEEDIKSSESSGRLRDIGCQTIESNLAQKLTESTKLTMLYPKEDDESKKASGDSRSQRSPYPQSPRADDMMDEKNRSRVNAILERRDKDPYLPAGKDKL